MALFFFSIHKLCIFIQKRAKVKPARNAQAQNPNFQIPNKSQISNPKPWNAREAPSDSTTAQMHDCTKHAHSACLGNAAKGLVEGVALGGGKTGFFDHGEEVLSSGGIMGACRAHDIFFNHDAAHIVGSKVKRYLGNR